MYRTIFGNQSDKEYQKNLKRIEWLNPFDKIFDDMLSASNPELYKAFGDSVFEKNAYPKVNIINNSEDVIIEAAVPGMREDEINIDLQGNVLTISGQNAKHKDATSIAEYDSSFLKREIKRSAFARSFTLSESLDISKIEARLDLGLLVVRIKKINPKEKEDFSHKRKILINK